MDADTATRGCAVLSGDERAALRAQFASVEFAAEMVRESWTRTAAAGTTLLGALDEAERQRDLAQARLAVAERWLRTLAANSYTGCPHGNWAEEALDDIAAAQPASTPQASDSSGEQS